VLIVNADDYGRTPGVSAGILRAHLEGIVTTTTVMVNLPGAVEAVGKALTSAPRLGLGVHLNLTFGEPVTPAADVLSLVDRRGQFHSIQALVQNPSIVELKHVEREWKAQIDRFLSTGAMLDHLDSHHHVSLLRPDLWDLYLELARSHRCGVRLSWPSEADAGPLTDLSSPRLRRFAELEAPLRLASANVPHPDYFFGSFYGSTATLEHLLELLATLPEGASELMTHPGVADQGLLTSSGYARYRGAELEALLSPSVLAALRTRGITLATYLSGLTSNP